MDNTRPAWHALCYELVEKFLNFRDSWPFLEPVDPKKWDVPDYFEVIKEPMDLTTIQQQLESGIYQHYTQVVHHLLLVFDNSIKYNPTGHPVRALAEKMLASVARHVLRILPKLVSTSGRNPLSYLPHPTPPLDAEAAPLASVHPYTLEWEKTIIARIESLAPHSLPRQGEDSRGKQGRRGRKSHDGKKAASRMKDNEEECDEERGSSSEDEGDRRSHSPSGSQDLGQGSNQPKALPMLPYGFYLTSSNPPLRFMNMPSSRNNHNIITVLRPETIPDWEERRQLWQQLRQVYVQVPGLQRLSSSSTGVKRNREGLEVMDGGDVQRHHRKADRGDRAVLGSGDREEAAARARSQLKQSLMKNGKADLNAMAAEFGDEMGLGARAFVLDEGSMMRNGELVAGSLSNGGRMIGDATAVLSPNCGLADIPADLLQSYPAYSNPSSLNVSLNMSGDDSLNLNQGGANAPSQATGPVRWMTVQPNAEVSGRPLLTLPVLMEASRKLHRLDGMTSQGSNVPGDARASHQQGAAANSGGAQTATGFNDTMGSADVNILRNRLEKCEAALQQKSEQCAGLLEQNQRLQSQEGEYIKIITLLRAQVSELLHHQRTPQAPPSSSVTSMINSGMMRSAPTMGSGGILPMASSEARGPVDRPSLQNLTMTSLSGLGGGPSHLQGGSIRPQQVLQIIPGHNASGGQFLQQMTAGAPRFVYVPIQQGLGQGQLQVQGQIQGQGQGQGQVQSQNQSSQGTISNAGNSSVPNSQPSQQTASQSQPMLMQPDQQQQSSAGGLVRMIPTVQWPYNNLK